MNTIYVDLEDQLGNQLYAYASAKSIARHLGFEFRFRMRSSKLINSTDAKRSHTLFALGIPLEERVDEIPISAVGHWREPPNRTSNFFPELMALERSTYIKGHLQSFRYFESKLNEVRSWFRFDEELMSRSRRELDKSRRELGVQQIVGVHYRCGPDYSRQWRTLSPSYYCSAMNAIKVEGRDHAFLLFSDRPERAQALLKGTGVLMAPRGSLFEDLSLLASCDGLVIGNSTFACWAGLLSGLPPERIVRPEPYFAEYGKVYPSDIFPPAWQVVSASRAIPTPSELPRACVQYVYNRAPGLRAAIEGLRRS